MNFSDIRGSFLGVVNEGQWQEVNYIESKAGTVRGNHYHKKTQELFFIISGEIHINVKDVHDKSINEFIAKKGDIFIIEPYEIHTFNILRDSSWINALSLKMCEQDKDIYNK